jgi:hypothetical protein
MMPGPANGILRLGCGAGFSGDRIEPAVELAERGNLDYLVFECLAERTIALAQQARARDPAGGYDPLLVERMEAVLPACLQHGTRIITNMGAANPRAAAARIVQLAREHDWHGLKIAAVTGDDVLAQVLDRDDPLLETAQPVSALGHRLVSANAYLGAAPLVEAISRGANLIITGRVADPALFLAPQVAAFNWSWDDWNALGRGTVVGHLLECAGQVTGGYFADPGHLTVPGLARLGFPIAEVRRDGAAVITKLDGTGGCVTPATCKAQLLYELHDPSAYLTPDVAADFSGVSFAEVGADRVQATGGRGRMRPDQLKVSVGYHDGYIGEGQISYAGPGARGRAQLAIEIVVDRLRQLGLAGAELRTDLIGVNALHPGASPAAGGEPYEVRVRIAGRAPSAAAARKIGAEVEALYTNGPAGGGGAFKSVREVLAIGTTFVPRDFVQGVVHFETTP